ncbi:leucine-rich repeat protein [Ruminococcus flavefaciens]|uniref:leucine-rich repeat protein n=1 Tax=Ruminococcus flavefaciens TaxID=1265 RepID=UPI000491736F|nr:leucine-rich repeat protein [Ruminococcus flavefaciens]
MKKMLSMLAAAALALSAAPVKGASAEETEGFMLSYTIDNKQATVTGCVGSDSVLIIPSELEGFPVTAIAEDAFAGNKDIGICVIPDSVKTIGERAFSTCPSLSTITIGSGVTKIGDYAFTACPALAYIDVNKNNPTYSNTGGCLYENGDTLLLYAGSPEAVIGKGTKTIRKGAFFGKADIVSVEFPDSVTTIDDHAFSGCLSLKKVDIPDSVTTLGKGCFMSCSALGSVSLGKGVKALPEDCFHSCTSLKTVNIPDTVTSIGDEAFYSCAGISGIYIPSSVKTIGKEALGRRYDARSSSSENISGFTIRGEKGSAAEKYASDSKLSFKTGRLSMGDVNGDGAVNAVDASAVLAEYAASSTGREGSFSSDQRAAADFNSDGSVNAFDASAILAEYARRATAPL